MDERLTELVLDEGKWVFGSMLGALIGVGLAFLRRAPASERRVEIVRAMNLFFACFLGLMAFGHLLAISVKLAQGTLEGPALLLYPLGVILLVPSALLVRHALSLRTLDDAWRRRATLLNTILVVSLLAFGLNNIPLALPAVLNVAYLFHSRRVVGWTIVAAEVATVLFLFVGSAIFVASGRSFEEFRGM